MNTRPVKSAERVFQILEYFEQARRPSRLSDIAKSLDLPISSVSALLHSMVALGYMEQDPVTSCYLPTGRIAHIVSWLKLDNYEHMLVLDEMWRLRELAKESVVLASPTGIHLEYVETVHGWESIHIKRGAKRLLVQTGTGWLFLARMDPRDAMNIYRRTIIAGEIAPHEFSEGKFLETVESHRDREVSFVHARELLRPTAHWGAAMISAIMPTPAGHRPLAIGVHGLSGRLIEKEDLISSELRRVAHTLGDHVRAMAHSRPSALEWDLPRS